MEQLLMEETQVSNHIHADNADLESFTDSANDLMVTDDGQGSSSQPIAKNSNKNKKKRKRKPSQGYNKKKPSISFSNYIARPPAPRAPANHNSWLLSDTSERAAENISDNYICSYSSSDADCAAELDIIQQEEIKSHDTLVVRSHCLELKDLNSEELQKSCQEITAELQRSEQEVLRQKEWVEKLEEIHALIEQNRKMEFEQEPKRKRNRSSRRDHSCRRGERDHKKHEYKNIKKERDIKKRDKDFYRRRR